MNIVVTGGFGFIGSNMVEFLNRRGITPWILEDMTRINTKWRNVLGLKYHLIVQESDWPANPVIIHCGAESSTRVPMNQYLWETNFGLTLDMHRRASKLIYMSSAATYGKESKDFSERVEGLVPINPYGFSKWSLDNYFFGGGRVTPNVYAIRPFNVYGPREQHKGELMASAIHKALLHTAFYRQDEKGRGYWELMASGSPDIPNTDHYRDFVYVEDVCKIIWFFVQNNPPPGIYNAGSGHARRFVDILSIINPGREIKFKLMPPELHKGFQYYTQADMSKIRSVGYLDEFTSLEEGIVKTREWLKENGYEVKE